VTLDHVWGILLGVYRLLNGSYEVYGVSTAHSERCGEIFGYGPRVTGEYDTTRQCRLKRRSTQSLRDTGKQKYKGVSQYSGYLGFSLSLECDPL
jgi:hypothetical protein